MTVRRGIRLRVERRARRRCEYCKMHQSLQGATFHLEHVIPRSHGGPTNFGNLALACPGCNLGKSNNITWRDPRTGEMSPLFNPRTDDWEDHLTWSGVRVRGKTTVGRATIAVLQLNASRRLRIRQAESGFGLIPP